ncbi:Prostatic acid phosphatase [Paramyrothecium foliicola]|nr:Prostatic acid phosphatase [Paramyrothecium foliicola]
MHQSLVSVLSVLASTAAAETVHGVVVYSRHGDRTTKHYGAQALTNLGARQNFQIGSAYRARYLSADSDTQILDISEDQYVKSQVYASAPNQAILANTATAFLQGLYPPLTDLDAEIAGQALNNGSESVSPLDGYQYIMLQGQSDKSPDTIWIKGDDGCPVITKASKDFEDSEEFQQLMESTSDFYSGFYDVLEPVYDYRPENMTYKNAYDIYDLINVARIHNATSLARNVSDDDLLQLRALAHSAEFGYNYNNTQKERAIHGQTLTAGLLQQLTNIVDSEAKLKFSLMAGSYDTFMSFFGLANLTSLSDNFTGLPDYASTMAFELFTEQDATSFPTNTDADLRVRWLFRNSTYGELTTWPLFGLDQESLPWPEFVSEMQKRSIGSVEEWCDVCSSTAGFCAEYEEEPAATASGGKGGMSNAIAGVIGAMVTLGVVALVAGAAFLMRRKRRAAQPVAQPLQQNAMEKIGSRSSSSV